MPTNKECGDDGENEVVKLIQCPNCGKKLQRLPQNFPLYDVQCTGCSFRAQVKTSLSAPKDAIFGAGWAVIEKVLKAGFHVPPLIVNFKGGKGNEAKQEIRFYPFIPKANLKKFQLSSHARQPNYKMFSYVGLEKLPHFTPYMKAENA
jgi:hypothetical protein